MSKKIATILLICSAFLFTACQKSLDIFVPDASASNGLDTTWYNSVTSTMPVAALQTNLSIEPLRDSFEIPVNSTTPIIINVNDAQFTFPPRSFVTTAGVIVTGKVYIDALVIKKKGDMVRMNKPTASNGSMLVSAGELFIRVKQNGQEVSIAPNTKYYIRYVDIPINQNMRLFFGDESNPARFNWLPNTGTDTLTAGTQAYEIGCSHLHWINVDYFYDTVNVVRSVISAKLPYNYTNANTSVFLVFKDYRSVLGMYGDAIEKKFISPKVPNGKAAVVVAISKQGNDYYLGKENITTGVNATSNVQSVNMTPVKTSLADIKLYLSTL